MPQPGSLKAIDREIIKSRANPAYFVFRFIKVKCEESGAQIPFHLWPAQVDVLKGIHLNRLVCLLKARQVGFTTLVLAYLIWLATFKPGSTILLFSKTQVDSKDLIRRIRLMLTQLPDWLQPRELIVDSTQELIFSNGSSFKAFASRSSGGDSYTASAVLVDEADLIQDLDLLLSGCKPTIDAGGRLILLSRSDKSTPNSTFKKIWKAAREGINGYYQAFIAWHARPGRDRDWYETIKREIESRTGSIDQLFELYPATPEEALSARTLDKRLPLSWLQQCFEKATAISSQQLVGSSLAGVPGLIVYKRPESKREYSIGIDAAEGNPTSDDSVAVVVDRDTLEEVAILVGKFTPTSIADHANELANWYNSASVLSERNNHGFAVLNQLRSLRCKVLHGRDGRDGWLSDRQGKVRSFDVIAETLRQGGCLFHTQKLMDQLCSIDINTLRAPEGDHDDLAIAYTIAIVGATLPVASPFVLTHHPQPEATAELVISSKYTGTKYISSLASWEAFIEVSGERISLGEYAGEEEAGAAVNAANELLGLAAVNSGDGAVDVEAIRLILRQRRLI